MQYTDKLTLKDKDMSIMQRMAEFAGLKFGKQLEKCNAVQLIQIVTDIDAENDYVKECEGTFKEDKVKEKALYEMNKAMEFPDDHVDYNRMQKEIIEESEY
jgi:hypothetical protein